MEKKANTLVELLHLLKPDPSGFRWCCLQVGKHRGYDSSCSNSLPEKEEKVTGNLWEEAQSVRGQQCRVTDMLSCQSADGVGLCQGL